METKLQLEGREKPHGTTLALGFKNMMESEKTYLLNGKAQAGCAVSVFIKSNLQVLSALHSLPPCFSQWDPLKMWLPSSDCPVGAFNGFPALLPGCLWLHLMTWGASATPLHVHPITHSSSLRSFSAPSLCPSPGLLCPQLFAWLPPPLGTCGFLRENFLDCSDSLRDFYCLLYFSTWCICRTHPYFN